MGFNTAKRALEEAKKKHTPKKYLYKDGLWDWVKKFPATAGRFAVHPSTLLAVDEDGVLASGLNGIPDSAAPRLLPFADALALAVAIDALAVGSNHLAVKQNVNWKRIYQVANRAVPFMDSDGKVDNAFVETVPCHNCGLIVPIAGMQVDHVMPQAGLEDHYTLKVARTLGLTVDGATGAKGKGYTAGTFGTTLVANPRGRATGNLNHLTATTAASKWTTNDRGTAFFSLVNDVGGFSSVAKRCMNNLLNLCPLCGDCNRVKSNFVKPIG
jgi:hypothetical protein